ncbi:YdcF family protein [Burkholderiaceae bacterium FT117]|uniref:YdcF family protein n=1 Tax=Zeimonas sediminis TaxID=2944268 RepID=UPI002342F80E|nr:YdcF family protein [Zeimonas sediminis]MCM5568924.1 YdcF family protein [Zeimonas sediminis]
MEIESVLAWLGQLPGQLSVLAAGLASGVDAALPRRLLGALLLPPALPLLVAALGLLLLRRSPRAGRLLAWLGLLAAWVFSSGAGAWWLASLAEGGAQRGQTVESLRAAMAGREPPQAIVILAGGSRRDGRETPDKALVRPLTLERLAHGAWVARTTRLPVLVSGGVSREGMASEASLMKRALEQSFGTPVRWVEESSRDTGENARNAAEMLGKAGVRRVILVTHAYHMPRAESSFRKAGLAVLPAPHGFAGGDFEFGLQDLVPSGSAAALAYRASHEVLGRLWYRLTGR